jgi:hypothetical protein
MTLTAKEIKYASQQERAAQLEEHLEQIAPTQLSTKHRLKLRDIVIQLILPHEITSDTKDIRASRTELRNLKGNLNRRTKLNDKLTSKALNNLSPDTEAILFSELALLFKSDLDNWAQIDFNDDQHVAHLSTGINKAIFKITPPQGRPLNVIIDNFFNDLDILYKDVTGHTGTAQAHYDDKPHTDFEHLIHLGFNIIKPAYSYPTTLKAWQRAVSRRS